MLRKGPLSCSERAERVLGPGRSREPSLGKGRDAGISVRRAGGPAHEEPRTPGRPWDERSLP